MLNADMVHETGHFSYADAERLADLWDVAYPAMREIATLYIEGQRKAIEGKVWEIDPGHPAADTLREITPPEGTFRRRLKLAEELRRGLGQMDRGTHRACTRSPGGFTVTASYSLVRQLLNISSFSSPGLPFIYRLAAVLAEAEERVNAERIAWHRKGAEAEDSAEPA